MEEKKSGGAHVALGITSLVLGILSFIFCFVPCLGVYAMYPGIIGLILGIIGAVMANKVKASMGMIIAGIVLSVLATAVAIWQYVHIHSAVSAINDAVNNLPK